MVQENKISNDELKQIVYRQPVGVGIVTNTNFRFYKEGIMTEEFLKCSDPSVDVNHGVAVVGFGKTKKEDKTSSFCDQYWIVRNTWGPNWGESGFFRMCMDGTGTKQVPYGTC
jgi:cathepsin H